MNKIKIRVAPFAGGKFCIQTKCFLSWKPVRYNEYVNSDIEESDGDIMIFSTRESALLWAVYTFSGYGVLEL